MDEDFWTGFLIGVVITIAIGLVIFLAYQSSWEKEAVIRGKAEYYLNENYNREWRWK